ncbi:MAG TPA: Maf family protein [Verrucomicrobiota bacterium]|nr:septum formation protein Maf [Verrucomicrobiales bacterium]HRI12411.1 Maf family protein [Verrucomicrobiota bacterium]
MNSTSTLLTRAVPLPPVILASQSSRRVELLREVLAGFRVSPSYATELHDSALGKRRLCEVNAQRKAFSVGERFPDHLVLGADTLVFLGDEPLSKPPDLAAARVMLGRLAGRVHEVVTGVCLVHVAAARMQVFSEVTYVRFRELSAEDITEYLERVNVLDKAGAYALQEQGHRLIETVEGSRSNVIGLPVEAVKAALTGW